MGVIGGADFGGGMTEWHTLQLVSNTALPSIAADAVGWSAGMKSPDRPAKRPVVRTLCTWFMALSCSWVPKNGHRCPDVLSTEKIRKTEHTIFC
jgi:hypothetical protein